MAEASQRQVFTPAVFYQDPMTALDWLEKAFGFERIMLITDEAGNLAHSEMSFDGGLITVGGEWNDSVKSPASIGGKYSQTIRVELDEDIDAHFQRAQAAGARVLMEPKDQFYGARTYSVLDLEGHAWAFSKTLRYVSREDAEKASGLKIEGWMEP
jgi:uncharacterized glyoxalase superfamily protein PhnB